MSVGALYKPVLSQKRKTVLILDGYVMAVNKNVAETFYWYCSHKYKNSCSSTAITTLQQGAKEHLLKSYSTKHNHAPDPSKVDELNFRTSIKREASTSLDQPSQIIQRNVANISKSSCCALPNKYASAQIIRRARKSERPKEPTSLDDVNVPEKLREVDGERFFGCQVKVGDEFILLFATKSNLKLLNRSEIWVMDGTFETCPILFIQLYSIHGFVGKGPSRQMVPLVYAFL